MGKNRVVLVGGGIATKLVEDFCLHADIPALKRAVIDISYADFNKAATTVVFDTGAVIPKGAFILKTLIDEVVKFEGGAISTAVIAVGDSDGSGGTTDPDRYNTGTPNVFQNADVLDAGAVSGTALHTADAEVAVTLTTSANANALTAGSAKITIFYLQAADHSS